MDRSQKHGREGFAVCLRTPPAQEENIPQPVDHAYQCSRPRAGNDLFAIYRQTQRQGHRPQPQGSGRSGNERAEGIRSNS